MDQINPVETFLLEADDLLCVIEEVALDMSNGRAGEDGVNTLFRAFHTLKGSGAMFGFDDVAGFTHHVETALDRVRVGSLAVTPQLLGCVLAAKDLIKAMLASRQNGRPVDEGEQTALVERFTALIGADGQGAATSDSGLGAERDDGGRL